jgi:hypothetical protein
MEPTATVPVKVSGATEERSEITWGHDAIRRWHGQEPDASFNFYNHESFALPPGCTVASLTAALGEVLHRYDGLRTVLRREDGRWWQHAQGAGESALHLFQSGDDSDGTDGDIAAAAGMALSEQPWTMKQWPMRFAAVGDLPAVFFLVANYNRLVLDSVSVQMVVHELISRADPAGTVEAPAEPWQPIAETRWERSAPGLAVNDRAMQHWRRSLSAAAPSMFDVPLLEPEEPRFRRFELTSPAMARAVRWMHRGRRIPPSGVLLGAFSLLLGRYTGHRAIEMHVLTGNRLDRQRRELISAVAGEGLFHLDLADGDGTFERLARAAFRVGGQAQRFGFCDPESVAGLKEELRVTRGAYIDLGVYVNDLIIQDYGEEPEPTAEDLQALTEQTVLDDAGGMPNNPTKLDMRAFLVLQRDADMPLALTADTRYLGSQTIRELLAGMERVIVAAVSGQTDLVKLADASGVATARRGPSWVRCGEGWADVVASRALWQQAVPDSAATVLEELVDGTARLVGYLVGDESTKLEDLHRRCVAALGLRTDVRTPAWYRVLPAAPARPEDPASWRSAPVLFEGDGR